MICVTDDRRSFPRVTQIVRLRGATPIEDISCGRVQVACGRLGPPLRVRGMPELRPVVSRRLRSLAMVGTHRGSTRRSGIPQWDAETSSTDGACPSTDHQLLSGIRGNAENRRSGIS